MQQYKLSQYTWLIKKSYRTVITVNAAIILKYKELRNLYKEDDIFLSYNND